MGIENAKGDFVAFLDSDDVWEPDKIEKQMPLFSNPATGLAYCGTSLIDAEGNPLPSKKTEKHSGNVLEKLLERNFIACSGVIVRKKLLTENGLYFLPGRKAAEDWDLWLRLAMITEFDFVDEPLVKYRSYPESISRDCRLSYNSTMVVIREISGEIRRRYSEGKAKKLLNILRRNRMNHDIALARSLYAGGEHGGAACVFFRTFLSYISGK
jgi:glycosyltransferase involved in cell wall biosynthesis